MVSGFGFSRFGLRVHTVMGLGSSLRVEGLGFTV